MLPEPGPTLDVNVVTGTAVVRDLTAGEHAAQVEARDATINAMVSQGDDFSDRIADAAAAAVAAVLPIVAPGATADQRDSAETLARDAARKAAVRTDEPS